MTKTIPCQEEDPRIVHIRKYTPPGTLWLIEKPYVIFLSNENGT